MLKKSMLMLNDDDDDDDDEEAVLYKYFHSFMLLPTFSRNNL